MTSSRCPDVMFLDTGTGRNGRFDEDYFIDLVPSTPRGGAMLGANVFNGLT